VVNKAFVNYMEGKTVRAYWSETNLSGVIWLFPVHLVLVKKVFAVA
jgi:hypothetical protein